MTRPDQSVFTREIVGAAVADSFRKLDPRGLVRNPVIFVVELGARDHERDLRPRRRPRLDRRTSGSSA